MSNICILTDHPNRDLPGNLILAKELIKKKHKVFLIPTKFMEECFLINPHLVIANHSRLIYEKFLKKLNEKKIKIQILDTEGAPFGANNSHYKFYPTTVTKYLDYIQYYYLWGYNQFEMISKYMKKKNLLYKNNLMISGSPMFDYHKIINRKKRKNKKIIILINLGFALANPRFSKNPNIEIENIKREINVKDKIARNNFKTQEKSFKNSLKFISKISKKISKKYKILLNPHPFENYEIYKKYFGDKKNILILKRNNIVPVINTSDIILSINCQTSIDSLLLNKPTLNLNFLNKKMIMSPILSKASIQIKSFKQCLNIINNFSFKETTFLDKLDSQKKILEKYFNNFKTTSADKISKNISKIKFKPTIKLNIIDYLYFIISKHKLLGTIKIIILFLLIKLRFKKNYYKLGFEKKKYMAEILKHIKNISRDSEKLSTKNCHYKLTFFGNIRLNSTEIILR